MRPSARFVLAALFAALVAGCGHAATEQECQEIVDKVVELESKEQGVTDPAAVAKRKEETRKSIGEQMMPRCVGKKIRDSAMACVRNAKSFDEIDNVCLR